MFVPQVRDLDAYDLRQRPLSYWKPGDPETLAIGLGSPDDPPLSPPPLDFGSYTGCMPEEECGDVNIAGIFYHSILGDCIDIRARFDTRDGRIYYRVVDEHGARITCKPECSVLPLTLDEITDMLDTLEPPDQRQEGLDYFQDIWGFNLDSLSNDYQPGFVEVSSPFYPQLGAWYKDREEVWLERARKEWEEEMGQEWEDS